MKYLKSLYEIVNRFSKCEEVEGIMIAGSSTTGNVDSESDYDVYVYLNKWLTPEKRMEMLDDLCSYMEYNNQFWEAEDDGILSEENKPIELIYRDLNWLDGMIEGKIMNHYADTGYTTCFWANLMNSEILYDRSGNLKKLKEKYDVPYPDKLAENIIAKNFPLLMEKMPAYYFQIEKAIKRGDRVSVNHRIAAFLASYFDIIFAVNKIPHPGEKKIISILKKDAEILPENMERDINCLFDMERNMDNSILEKLKEITGNLKKIL